MAYEPPEKKWPWQDYLTVEEAKEVADADSAIAEHRSVAQQASVIRQRIVNRAIQRAKYAALNPKETAHG
jgi:hypothetical protein